MLTLNILVADDDKNINALMRRLLTLTLNKITNKATIRFTNTSNGLETLLELVQPERQFDLVFLDVMMPVFNGLEILEIMRQTEYLVATPVVVVSGHTDRALVSRMQQLNILMYLVKPIMSTVDERLSSILRSALVAKHDKQKEQALSDDQQRRLQKSVSERIMLVVHPEAQTAKEVQQYLKDEYSVEIATDSAEGITKYAELLPSVVVVEEKVGPIKAKLFIEQIHKITQIKKPEIYLISDDAEWSNIDAALIDTITNIITPQQSESLAHVIRTTVNATAILNQEVSQIRHSFAAALQCAVVRTPAEDSTDESFIRQLYRSNKALIIEPNDSFRSLLSGLIASEFTVLSARDIFSGLRLYQEHEPGLVIISEDIQKINSSSITSKIYAISPSKKPAVFMLSALPSQQNAADTRGVLHRSLEASSVVREVIEKVLQKQRPTHFALRFVSRNVVLTVYGSLHHTLAQRAETAIHPKRQREQDGEELPRPEIAVALNFFVPEQNLQVMVCIGGQSQVVLDLTERLFSGRSFFTKKTHEMYSELLLPLASKVVRFVRPYGIELKYRGIKLLSNTECAALPAEDCLLGFQLGPRQYGSIGLIIRDLREEQEVRQGPSGVV